jgi:hypothetical protein
MKSPGTAVLILRCSPARRLKASLAGRASKDAARSDRICIFGCVLRGSLRELLRMRIVVRLTVIGGLLGTGAVAER